MLYNIALRDKIRREKIFKKKKKKKKIYFLSSFTVQQQNMPVFSSKNIP